MTVLAALAAAVRERLVAGSPAPLPGFCTLARHHVPARVQARPDGSRVLLPPSETIRFSQDPSDPSGVAAALARSQGLPAASAAPALRDAVDQLEAIVIATGEARLPGVGLFRRTSSRVLFAADPALLTEVNRPYAGLRPVEAAPARPASASTPPAAPATEGAPPDVEATAAASPAEPDLDALRSDLATTTDASAPGVAETTVEPARTEASPESPAQVEQAAADMQPTAEAPPDAEAPPPSETRPTVETRLAGEDARPDWASPTGETAHMESPAEEPSGTAAGLAATSAVSSMPGAAAPPDVPASAETAPTEKPAPPPESALATDEPDDTELETVEPTAGDSWAVEPPAPEAADEAPTETASPDIDAAAPEPPPTHAPEPETPDAEPSAEDLAEVADPSTTEPSTPIVDPDPATPDVEAELLMPDIEAEPTTHDVEAEARPPRAPRRRDALGGVLGGTLSSMASLRPRGSRRRDRPDAAAPFEAPADSADAPTDAAEAEPRPEALDADLATGAPDTGAPDTGAPETEAPPATDALADAAEAARVEADLDDSATGRDAVVEDVAAEDTTIGDDLGDDLSDRDFSDGDFGDNLSERDLGDDLTDGDLVTADPAAPALLGAAEMPLDGMPTEPEADEPLPADEVPATSSLLDELFPSSEGPDAAWGDDLGAASAGATAAGLGLDDADFPRPAADRVPRSSEVAEGPIAPPAPSRRFGVGSLVLLAVSIGAIAAAMLWPRFTDPPPPRPATGRGGFGDTLGDAAEAAFRDSIARVAASPTDSAALTAPAPAQVPASADSAYTPAPVTPEAAPEVSSPAPVAGRRTLGVAPPAGTAILPPRVAGLDAGGTTALASRNGLTLGGGVTWVVLSTASRDEAERLAARYKQSGYRADVIASTAAGRTTFRVGVGQFPSRELAGTLRDRLPPQAPADTWPLDLSSRGLSL